MRFLVCIPCLYHAESLAQCIQKLMHEDVTVVLLDNGSEPDVKNIIAQYTNRPNVHIERSDENIYVNPAWNLFIAMFFQSNEFSHLIILNSDLVLQNDWVDVLKKRLRKNPNEITLPVIDATLPDKVNTEYSEGQTVTSGTAGVFICLSRLCAQLVYPIPQEIRVWFGDNFIFGCLRGMGFSTVIAPNLHAVHYHGGSKSVSRTPNISAIIEQDKVAWVEVEKKMQEKIKEFNTQDIS